MALAELECILQLVVAPGATLPVSAHFSYRSWEPYSIHVVFHLDERASVSWVFGRDLLAQGTVRPSGLGDVKIWPGVSEQGGVMWLELASPDGRALFTAPLDVVRPWLARTYHLVPAGFEGASLDLDSELSRLLGEVA